MGRYYNGDIEGKFWFGVQSSDDADFFGSTGEQPNYLEYYFDGNHMPDIDKGIDECYNRLGENKEKFDKFFDENNGYNDEMLKEAGLDPALLEWYARLDLGLKIKDCVNRTGECQFEAEL